MANKICTHCNTYFETADEGRSQCDTCEPGVQAVLRERFNVDLSWDRACKRQKRARYAN